MPTICSKPLRRRSDALRRRADVDDVPGDPRLARHHRRQRAPQVDVDRLLVEDQLLLLGRGRETRHGQGHGPLLLRQVEVTRAVRALGLPECRRRHLHVDRDGRRLLVHRGRGRRADCVLVGGRAATAMSAALRRLVVQGQIGPQAGQHDHDRHHGDDQAPPMALRCLGFDGASPSAALFVPGMLTPSRGSASWTIRRVASGGGSFGVLTLRVGGASVVVVDRDVTPEERRGADGSHPLRTRRRLGLRRLRRFVCLAVSAFAVSGLSRCLPAPVSAAAAAAAASAAAAAASAGDAPACRPDRPATSGRPVGTEEGTDARAGHRARGDPDRLCVCRRWARLRRRLLRRDGVLRHGRLLCRDRIGPHRVPAHRLRVSRRRARARRPEGSAGWISRHSSVQISPSQYRSLFLKYGSRYQPGSGGFT